MDPINKTTSKGIIYQEGFSMKREFNKDFKAKVAIEALKGQTK